MDVASGQLDRLLELEARHDDLLERLEELDHRVRRVLAKCQPAGPSRLRDQEVTAAGPDAPTY